jgi:hypothetical protein
VPPATRWHRRRAAPDVVVAGAATKSRRIEGSSGIHVDWAGALKSDGAGNVAAPGEPSFELDVTVEGSSSLGKGVLDLSQLESLASGRRGGAAVVAVAAAAAGAGGNVNGDAVIQQSARNAVRDESRERLSPSCARDEIATPRRSFFAGRKHATLVNADAKGTFKQRPLFRAIPYG